jgi:hypothetical protein
VRNIRCRQIPEISFVTHCRSSTGTLQERKASSVDKKHESILCSSSKPYCLSWNRSKTNRSQKLNRGICYPRQDERSVRNIRCRQIPEISIVTHSSLIVDPQLALHKTEKHHQSRWTSNMKVFYVAAQNHTACLGRDPKQTDLRN